MLSISFGLKVLKLMVGHRTGDSNGIKLQWVNRTTVGHVSLCVYIYIYISWYPCVKLCIGSDNGLSLVRCQAIIWTYAGLLLIGPLRTNLSEILIEIQTFSLKKIRLKMSSVICCPFRLGLKVLSLWLGIERVISHYSKTMMTQIPWAIFSGGSLWLLWSISGNSQWN